MRIRNFLLLLAVSCCGHGQPLSTPGPAAPVLKPELTSPAPSPLLERAISGVDSAEFKEVLAAHWEWMMRWAPTWATNLGDHRYDDRLTPSDLDAVQRWQREQDDLFARAKAIDTAALSQRDRTTHRLFLEGFVSSIAQRVCRNHLWALSPTNNSLNGLSHGLGEQHPVKTPKDAQNLLSRLRQVRPTLLSDMEHLREGKRQGYVANRETLRRLEEMLSRELDKPTPEWGFFAPAKREYPSWPVGERERFAKSLRDIIDTQIRPATVRFRDMVREELKPAGRDAAHEGISNIPEGLSCYQAMMLDELGREYDPQVLHDLGLREIGKSDEQLRTLGGQLFGTTTLEGTLKELRESPRSYFENGEQILSAGKQAIAKAQAALPSWFMNYPKDACTLSEIPAREGPYAPLAYYRAPHYDGTKPGEFCVNTYKPETRTRFDFEVLSYHEAIPGHHLQIALAQRLGDLPLFRAFGGSGAYIEGWALYAERLADEMNLYSGPLDRLGMWNFEAWRSARLVVDTGLHALGWPRERAEAFMLAHTALTAKNVSNEVDRYLSNPAQALTYKVGQLTILDLRNETEQRLGSRFDIRVFHEAVLGAGAVSLPVLEDRVRALLE